MSSKQSRTTHRVIFISCLLVLTCVLLLAAVLPKASADSSQHTFYGTQSMYGIERLPGGLTGRSQRFAGNTGTLQQQSANAVVSVVPDAFSNCFSGNIAASDTLFDHPESVSPTCNPSATTSREDHYLLTLSGCTTFPASVTISACGPGGCAFVPAGTAAQCAAETAGINDTTISIYRKGGATAGTASGSGFNPTDPCGTTSVPQRLVGYADDTGGCGTGGTLSSVTLSLGAGDFDVVISGFSDLSSCEGRGLYNLSVSSAAAGCTLTQQPTAAPAAISGRVTTPDGAPLGGVSIFLDGAQSQTAITDANGNYSFENAVADRFYTVTPEIANYTFTPQNRSFSLLGNKTDATFTATPNAIATQNPLETPEYFVRQQYLDFLGREPDQDGLDFWAGKLNACGPDAACVRQERIEISAAFFASEEFRQTGSFVYRLYKAGLGRELNYQEFTADRAQVVDNGALSASRDAFANSFVQRAEFLGKYNGANSASSFVSALLQTIQQASGVGLSAERDALIARYQTGTSMNESRSLALRDAIEAASFKQSEMNTSFVLTEYFGYLRRDADAGGYQFWLDVLNNRVAGNYRSMVCAFLTSAEYQKRFSPVVTRSNSECSQ